MRGFASLWRHGGFGLIAMLALLALAILGFAVGVFGDTSAKESPALVGEAAGGALLGALATGLVGLILFVHARHQDESGLRELLATELDLLSKQLEWPDDLMPLHNTSALAAYNELWNRQRYELSWPCFDALLPKLPLMSTRSAQATVSFYRRLAKYPDIRGPQPARPDISRSATTESHAKPANERAALSLAAAELARDLSSTPARKRHTKELRRRLEAGMPDALEALKTD